MAAKPTLFPKAAFEVQGTSRIAMHVPLLRLDLPLRI